MKRLVLALCLVSLLGGCSLFNRDQRSTTPTVGQRIPVLATEAQIEPDPLLAAIPVTVPPPAANDDWAQPGGNASKSMGHVALGEAPARAWSVSIGAGNSFRTRLVAEPVVGAGRVYTIDTNARVRAFDLQTGATVWEHQLRGENSPSEALFGGGVTFDNGRVYATNGAGDAAALDAATGNRIWLVKPGGPLRGAPTVALELNTGQRVWEINISGISTPWVAGDWVFVVTDQAQLLCIARSNGHIRWISQLPRYRDEEDRQGPIFWRGPVLAGDRLILAGSNGSLLNVSPTNGRQLTGLRTGDRFSLPPVVAGNMLFMLSDEGRLTAWR